LFNVVDSSGSYVLEDDKPPKAPRAKVLSYALEAYMVFLKALS
jgi:hypothetical protein